MLRLLISKDNSQLHTDIGSIVIIESISQHELCSLFYRFNNSINRSNSSKYGKPYARQYYKNKNHILNVVLFTIVRVCVNCFHLFVQVEATEQHLYRLIAYGKFDSTFSRVVVQRCHRRWNPFTFHTPAE